MRQRPARGAGPASSAAARAGQGTAPPPRRAPYPRAAATTRLPCDCEFRFVFRRGVGRAETEFAAPIWTVVATARSGAG